MRTPRRLFLLAACVVAGCSTSPPQVMPWEKGHLAKPEMTFDAHPAEQALTEHVYSSKEGASGGTGVGGGGCGCN